MEGTLEKMLSSALQYAELGYPVFPCVPSGKRPLTKHGFKDATTDPEQIRAVIAGGPEAVFEAREGAEDIAEDGAAAVEGLGTGDLLIAVSASSATPFVLGALASARSGGARTILVTCTPPDGISAVADLVLALDTGPEVLTGSTRLKAASATKAVLNAITTAAMVRLGKVYGNLMVDLRPGSEFSRPPSAPLPSEPIRSRSGP